MTFLKTCGLALLMLLPTLPHAQEAKFRADILLKAIASDKVDVFLVDGARRKCHKVKHRPAPDGKNFGTTDEGQPLARFDLTRVSGPGHVTLDGTVHVPWESELLYDAGPGLNIMKRCGFPTSGIRFNEITKVFETETAFPYAWELKLTRGYCAKNAIYTNCRNPCLQNVPQGSPVFSFILSKDLAEKISGTSCR